MSTTIVRRQPRREAPELPAGEVVLEPPPSVPRADGKAWTQVVTILPMLAGSGAMMLMFTGGRGGPLSYVAGGLFGVSMLGMIAVSVLQNSGQSKKELIAQRRDYMRALSLQRRKVRTTVDQQRRAMFYRHPEPDTLWATAASYRLWERRRADADFGVVRIGLGPQALATPLIPPQTGGLDELEPLCASALRRFVMTYSAVDGLPIAMSINGFSRVHVTGKADRTRDLVRAALAQIAVHHSPDDLLIAICCGPTERSQWEWSKWLPHVQHPDRSDALGRLRLVGPTIPSLEAMLDDLLVTRPRFNPAGPVAQLPGPHLVVVVDGGDVAGSSHLMTDGGVEGVTILDLSGTPPRMLDGATLVLDVANDGRLTSRTKDLDADIGTADRLSGVEAEALARQLAPLRLSVAAGGDQALSTSLGLAELLQLGDPYTYEPAKGWAPRPNRDRLRVPIAIGPDGLPVDVDLKESAQDGMGPHGLLIGATGAGKSELLRTLVLALAVTHDSETLNFVLVDFKGGATFTKLDRLPHTSAVITNLSDELPLVDRMTDAINGELLRRQELLRAAGNYSSVRDYEKARASGAPLAPLPSLLIICDEFSELLSAKPEFIDMFVQIGRVGRSLGVHLLLASQRLEEGRLRGLDTHLSYRIGLRTNSAMESRVVLGSPDAFELPRAPGHGYVKFGTDPLIRFRAAYVSGMYRRAAGRSYAGGDSGSTAVLEFDTQYVAPVVEDEDAPKEPDEVDDDEVGESLLDVLVSRFEGQGTPAHAVWLPPLAEPPTLDQLLPSLVVDPERGLTVSGAESVGSLKAVVGVIDKPLEQRRDPYVLDFSGSGGHAAVVGGVQSGKSTLLRTIVATMALTHTPREVQFYCLDFGGGGLASLRDLPHVGGVAGRTDVDQVRRTVAEMETLVSARERRFAQHGIEGIADYRRRKRAGEFAEDPWGDVFLVVDNWASIRNDYEDLELVMSSIAGRGLSYGVHVIASAARWMDFRGAVRDLFGTKLELRLGEPSDSMLDRRTAMNVPAEAPGRGITPDRLHSLSAVPRIDGEQTADGLGGALAVLVRDVRQYWKRAPAPPVRLLPAVVAHGDLKTDPSRGLAVGLAEADLQAAYVDLTVDSHLVVYGDSESGKTAFLRSIAHRITEQYTPQEARIIMIDHRRGLLGTIGGDHLIGYGTSAQTSTDIIAEVASVMKQRLPGPDVTPDQLRNRSWWRGPELYFLIDDYDLVANSSPHPATPLIDYLPQARDVGLHVILTRRSGGAGRAQFESMLMRMRELAVPGIVMSGNKDEGALVGNVKPMPLPPGRGILVTRKGGNQLVQLAWYPPD